MVETGLRGISILGATGSVGESTLDLIRAQPEAYKIIALTANGNAQKLAQLAIEFQAQFAVIADAEKYPELREALAGSNIQAMTGPAALVEAAATGADWTMAAIVGTAGLKPTLAAIEQGKTVALANKEALVSAGDLMMAEARTSGATLLPVDSEHNAIFQCLQGGGLDEVAKITLTASGGPFRTWTAEQMKAVTPQQAVAHPNWDMGAKISVDSATMMNKGLELIEAHHLFPVGLNNIQILVHPQSVIHSMVEFKDRSTLAQLGSPDMRIPIAHALAWPARMETFCQPLNLAEIGSLDFENPREDIFPATRIARNAITAGPAQPAIMNAANEMAVAAFLEHTVGFPDIMDIVSEVLDRYSPSQPTSLADIFAIDEVARNHAKTILNQA